MSADPIIYCLENLTDYPQFERIASDVMNQSGFTDIEPLGGSNDRGRDALHVSKTDGVRTIFAYSVRGDWRKKLLKEDCKRIEEEGHELDQLVFVCTASITSTQKDDVEQTVLETFGWKLQLYDLERLRVRLATDLRYLIARHPAIFCPPFFPTKGGLSIAESRDTIVIDHLPDQHALASWLSRRLQLAGYRVWCYGTAPLAGENADESIRTLIKQRAARYLPIVSAHSVSDPDFLGRVSIASGYEGLVLPCVADSSGASNLPSTVRQLAPSDFSVAWSAGLAHTLSSLKTIGDVPLSTEQGRSIALRSYVPEEVVRHEEETVYSNSFAVTVPAGIKVCKLTKSLSDAEQEALRGKWAFVVADDTTYLSFTHPPDTVPLEESEQLASYSWKHYPKRYEKYSTNVVRELVKKSLGVACVDAGLLWCEHRKKFYFSQGENPLHNLSYTHVDGRKTRITATGEKHYGSGDRARPFRYQLCPIFRVGQDQLGGWWVTLRLYVRITEKDGTPCEKKAITRRRRKVSNNWWNKEWFARTLAVIQALAQGKSQIEIGNGTELVTVSVEPMRWQCPVAIDYKAVERIGDFQEEIAELRYRDYDEEEADDSEEDDNDE